MYIYKMLIAADIVMVCRQRGATAAAGQQYFTFAPLASSARYAARHALPGF